MRAPRVSFPPPPPLSLSLFALLLTSSLFASLSTRVVPLSLPLPLSPDLRPHRSASGAPAWPGPGGGRSRLPSPRCAHRSLALALDTPAGGRGCHRSPLLCAVPSPWLAALTPGPSLWVPARSCVLHGPQPPPWSHGSVASPTPSFLGAGPWTEDVRLWDCRCGGRQGRHEGPRYGDGEDRARRTGGLHPYACRYLLLGAPMMANGACADAQVPGVVNNASNH